MRKKEAKFAMEMRGNEKRKMKIDACQNREYSRLVI